MNDALGYIRVSREEQSDSGLGLEAQRQRIAAYCDELFQLPHCLLGR